MTAADVDTVAAGTRPADDDPKPGRHLIFAIVSLAIFMMALDQTIVATALGAIQRELHTQVNWSTWTISVYSLGQIVILPLAGRLSDQFGRKRIFVAAIVVFTLASLCCGLANDIYVLVALRAVQSIGGGAFMPSATGIVSDQYGRDRDRAIGLFSSIIAIGGIVGPIFGGLFVTYWTWRGIFFVNVPIGIALLILTLVFVPDVRRGVGRRLDGVGSVLLCVGLLSGMFAMALVGSSASSWRWPTVAACAVVAVGGLVGFVRRSARVEHPVIPIRLLRGAGFGLMNGINFVWGSAIFGFSALVPLYAEERYGLPSLGAGTLLTARAVGMAVVTALAAMALRRTGYRRPILLGFVVTAAGLFLLSIAPHGLTDYSWLAVAAAIAGIGNGVAIPASNNAILQLAPDDVASVAGLRAMFRQCGGITGLSVVSALAARWPDHGLTLAHAFAAFGVLLLLLTPLVFRIPEHRGSW